VTGQSFETYVASRGGALWRTAWLLVGDAQGAEDLVQAALAKCWPRWDDLREPAAAHAYVRRAMMTTYTDWRRRRWTGEVPSDSPPEPSAAGPGTRTLGVEVDVDLRQDVLRALATLPRGQRAVVVLRYYDDLTETATAEALGISVGTVKSQTARAMAALRTSGLLQRPGTEET
jgi:RNA polymerase sigma-70 factor (sigma-E family)